MAKDMNGIILSTNGFCRVFLPLCHRLHYCFGSIWSLWLRPDLLVKQCFSYFCSHTHNGMGAWECFSLTWLVITSQWRFPKDRREYLTRPSNSYNTLLELISCCNILCMCFESLHICIALKWLNCHLKHLW